MDSNHSGQDEMLTERQAAALIGVAAPTLNRWRCKRIGPAFVRVSARCIRYNVADVKAWLEARRVETSDSRRLATASGPDPRGDVEATR